MWDSRNRVIERESPSSSLPAHCRSLGSRSHHTCLVTFPKHILQFPASKPPALAVSATWRNLSLSHTVKFLYIFSTYSSNAPHSIKPLPPCPDPHCPSTRCVCLLSPQPSGVSPCICSPSAEHREEDQAETPPLENGTASRVAVLLSERERGSVRGRKAEEDGG